MGEAAGRASGLEISPATASAAVLIPDYPPPQTVSEYNLLIPERERRHYHFTGPFLEVDLSRYHFGQETIFTSFGGEPYKLPLYRLLRTIADTRKDLIFDVFYTGAILPGIFGQLSFARECAQPLRAPRRGTNRHRTRWADHPSRSAALF